MTKRILSIVAAIILGVVSNAHALPILHGSVHVDDPTATSGTATYTFYNVPSVDGTDFILNELNLFFVGTVFNLAGTSVNQGSLPTGWGVITHEPGIIEIADFNGANGFGISEGEALVFTAQYSLLGLPDTDTWRQLFGGSGDLVINGFTFPTSTGGITSPAPEPTSILLLGAGLAGLGFLGRRRFRGRS